MALEKVVLHFLLPGERIAKRFWEMPEEHINRLQRIKLESNCGTLEVEVVFIMNDSSGYDILAVIDPTGFIDSFQELELYGFELEEYPEMECEPLPQRYIN